MLKMKKKRYVSPYSRRPDQGPNYLSMVFPVGISIFTISMLASQGAFSSSPVSKTTPEQQAAFERLMQHHSLMDTFNMNFGKHKLHAHLDRAGFKTEEIALYATCRTQAMTRYETDAYPAWRRSEYTLNCMTARVPRPD